ncbi:IS3 family transposase [Carboxydichorda subterranea]
MKTAIFEYVEGFCNRHRRHSALGSLSPDEFERRWYLHHEAPVTAG